MELHEKIKEVRKSTGLNQTDFAQKIGIDNSQYSKIERGQLQITLNQLMEIISKFKIEPNKLIDGGYPETVNENSENYLQKRRKSKLLTTSTMNNTDKQIGIPIYDVPIDASFLERYREDGEEFEPIGFLNLPKLRNCNFAAVISGNSMYPIMKSGTIIACRIIENLDYFDEGEMYLIATTNGFETVKYVQTGDNPDELKLIPHNEKIKPTYVKKSMVIRVCLVEAWLNFR